MLVIRDNQRNIELTKIDPIKFIRAIKAGETGRAVAVAVAPSLLSRAIRPYSASLPSLLKYPTQSEHCHLVSVLGCQRYSLQTSSVDHIFIEDLSIMNIHQMTLVLAVASLVSLSSGFITPVINGLTISLPLLGVSSTAGLSTVLAALGALKLGAAILLLASSEQEDEVVADAYGAPEVEEYAAPVVDEYGAPARYR